MQYFVTLFDTNIICYEELKEKKWICWNCLVEINIKNKTKL